MLKKLFFAFPLKSSIANGDKLINKIAIEFNSERKTKRQTRAHAR